jgi:cell division protein FtsN
MMMILIPAFIIIASVASYYLFFNNSVDVSEIQKNVPGIQKSVTEDKGSLKSDKLPTESSDKLLSEKAADQPDITEQNKIIQEGSAAKSANSSIEENEVSQNIYYDGKVYNVQVSSWKQVRIAERELQKLIDRGYPAYIYKIYIPKFDGTWHRVRVGPYNTLNEAKAVRDKLN